MVFCAHLGLVLLAVAEATSAIIIIDLDKVLLFGEDKEEEKEDHRKEDDDPEKKERLFAAEEEEEKTGADIAISERGIR